MPTTLLGYNLLARGVMLANGLATVLATGFATLAGGMAAAQTVEKISPTIRESPLPADAAQDVNWRHIEAFSRSAVLLSADDAQNAGRVLLRNQTYSSVVPRVGDVFFTDKTNLQPGEVVLITQPAKPLKMKAGQALKALVTERLGEAEVLEVGDVSTLRLLDTRKEITKGAWVVPVPPADSYTANTPDLEDVVMVGEVLSVIGDHPVGVNNSVLAMSIAPGLTLGKGQPLVLMSPSESVKVTKTYENAPFRVKPELKSVTLPPQDIGKAVVVSTKDDVAVVFVTAADQTINTGTSVRSIGRKNATRR